MAAPVVDNRSTRDRILDVALAAFAQRGVEATSLDSLAAEIGVRKQTILYWFASKEQLLLGVIDRTVDDLGTVIHDAVLHARASSPGRVPSPGDRLVAAVDATFRLGTARPELLAVVREVVRAGPPASTHLVAAVEPLVAEAVGALGPAVPAARVRRTLLAVVAQVVGAATEAQIRSDLGLAPDLAWLRARRRSLVDQLTAGLLPGS